MRDPMVPEDASNEIPSTPIERPDAVPSAPVQVDPQQALKSMFLGDDPQSKLQVVEHAIFEIMFGGQSYQIGTRKFTYADLKQLMALRNSLRSDVAAMNGSFVTVGIARRY